MKIIIISDAWHPQINGVVRTYEALQDELKKRGHDVVVLGPQDCRFRIKMPGYAEIDLALLAHFELPLLLKQYVGPHADPHTDSTTVIHIATEGPMGFAAKSFCRKHDIPYTTIYHTEFPDYVAKRVGKIFLSLTHLTYKISLAFIRNFHKHSQNIFVATKSLADKLRAQNFKPPLVPLTRGINPDFFHANLSPLPAEFVGLKKPIALYVGRIAIEKNLERFCEVEWQGSKVLIGTGPDLESLKKSYPDCVFLGKKIGSALGDCYRHSDLFVFPSKTDTFGMVLIEAMACGLPIAAYPVTGPIDIVTQDFLGVLDSDLKTAMQCALKLSPDKNQRADYAIHHYNWAQVAEQFLSGCKKN
jgi:glycosyltransferase involved in cell wall biosynthesis